MKRFTILTKLTEDKDVSGSDVCSVRNLLTFRRNLFYPKDIVLWLFGLYYGCLACTVVVWLVLWLLGLYCGCWACTVVVWLVLWLLGLYCGCLACTVVVGLVLWLLGLYCGCLAYTMVV